MALYTIGDFHLSENSDKPMDVFGKSWENHKEKLLRGFSSVTDTDTVVICGDLSWAMTLPDALEDFRFLDALPGKKILLKGNHDYYWTSLTKMDKFLKDHGLSSISFLHNNSYLVGDSFVCGSRGWFCDSCVTEGPDRKILTREVARLQRSLDSAGEDPKLVFLHYPPIYGTYRCEEILTLLKQYQVPLCVYGHIHGPGLEKVTEGTVEGIRYLCVSADHIGFSPVRLT